MIEQHNNTVTDDDIVLMVGDLSAALRGRENHFKELLKLLKGQKILVRGNHDYQTDDWYKEAGFIDVVNYFKIPPYFINHYPCYLSKWTSGPEKAMINCFGKDNYHTIIHGHIHNKNPNEWEPDGFERINVCVDYEPNQFKPVELTQPIILNYFINEYKK